MTSYVIPSQVYRCSVTAHLSLTSRTDSKGSGCAASSSPSDEPMGHSTTLDNRKGELARNDESAAKNRKVVTLEFKFNSNVNGVTEEIADHGMLTSFPWDVIYICR